MITYAIVLARMWYNITNYIFTAKYIYTLFFIYGIWFIYVYILNFLQIGNWNNFISGSYDGMMYSVCSHYTVYSVHGTVYSVLCIVYLVRCTLYNDSWFNFHSFTDYIYIINKFPWWINLLLLLFYGQCTLYTIECTLYSVHYTMNLIQCTVYTIQWTIQYQ